MVKLCTASQHGSRAALRRSFFLLLLLLALPAVAAAAVAAVAATAAVRCDATVGSAGAPPTLQDAINHRHHIGIIWTDRTVIIKPQRHKPQATSTRDTGRTIQ